MYKTIYNQRAIEDTLDRINNKYGAGRIIRVEYTSFADMDKTRPVKGFVIVQRQFGNRTYEFDLLTHGNNKVGVKFRGIYRIAKTN